MMLPSLSHTLSDAFLWVYNCALRHSSLVSRAWSFVYHITYTLVDVELDNVPFTNYGYAILEGNLRHAVDDVVATKQKTIAESIPKDLQDQWSSILLYAAVLCQAEKYADGLEGKDVLEVGSGRGGGCLVAHALAKPNKYLGIDLCEAGVIRSRCLVSRTGGDFLRDRQIRFCEGNSVELEKRVFPDSFDIVFNVESSHCYPDVYKFFQEVHKALRPGGMFLWCDLQFPWQISSIRWAMCHAGLKVVQFQNITENVREALRSGSLDPLTHGFNQHIDSQPLVKRILCRVVWNWCGIFASKKVVNGHFSYHMVACKKVVGEELEQMRQEIGDFNDFVRAEAKVA